MHVWDIDDTTRCRYFFARLKGIAQRWFHDLPNGNINSFLKLVELFSTNFNVSKRERKTRIHLDKIRQGKGEALKEYVMRFNREAILIPDLQDGVAYIAFFNALPPIRFKYSLTGVK